MKEINDVGEQEWWALSDARRVQFERAISAIVAYYGGNRQQILALLPAAVQRGYAMNMTVIAVLWRLREEVSND